MNNIHDEKEHPYRPQLHEEGQQQKGKNSGEEDFLDLLGRIPGKVSDLQEEIDKMKNRQKK